jgi:hypothetical protein
MLDKKYTSARSERRRFAAESPHSPDFVLGSRTVRFGIPWS